MQGVGFRYFCCQLAKSLNLSGWVKNNHDRTVSIYAEGDRSQIEELISGLKVGPSAAKVNDVKIRFKEFTGEFKSFEVIG